MQLPMYTNESANWYALINRAQVSADYYFHPVVENYLVYVLAIMSGELETTGKLAPEIQSTAQLGKRDQQFLKTRRIAEQSLVISGLFPDHANNTGVPLVYLIEKGQQAYTQLANAKPAEISYAYLSNHFTKAIDVLQVISQICGQSQSIDLLQACELWHETRSKHSLFVIRNQIGKLPTSHISELRH